MTFQVEDLSDSFGVIMGFINHNYMLFKTKSKWALLYKLAPGINFVVNQIIQRNLIDVLYDGYQANLEQNKKKSRSTISGANLACYCDVYELPNRYFKKKIVFFFWCFAHLSLYLEEIHLLILRLTCLYGCS